MRKRMAVVLAAALFGTVVLGSPVARGTSYDPMPRAEEGESAVLESGPGATVYLFVGGTEAARHALRVDDVLVVSRVGPDGSSADVGKVRVAALLGEVCLRAEVLEGRVRAHDLAAKDGVYSLVIPEAVCRR